MKAMKETIHNKLNMKKVNFLISEIIEIYNTASRVLDNKVTKVNIKSYPVSSQEKLLIEVTNGSYWIIETEDGKEWLIPSNKLTVNQFNYKSIQSFFEFQSHDDSENKDFVLIQPAIVSLVPNASKKEWKLETLGILNFDPNYSTNKLRSQLKQTEKERDQYQSELEKIKQENEQLTSQVAKLASDSLQDIRASLVTKDELNQQIKILMEQITELSFKQTNDSQKHSSNTISGISQQEYVQIYEQIYQGVYNQLYQKFDSKIKKIDQKVNNGIYQNINLQDLEKLENRIQKLERRKNNQNLDHYPQKQTYSEPKTQQTSYRETNKTNQTNQSNNTYSLPSTSLPSKQITSKNAIEVSETEESASDRRLGKSKTVILEENRRGNYWIVEKEDYTYLIPSIHLRINQYNYKTVELIFECQGYEPNISSHFELLQPAIVKKTTEGNNWQLDQPEVLQF